MDFCDHFILVALCAFSDRVVDLFWSHHSEPQLGLAPWRITTSENALLRGQRFGLVSFGGRSSTLLFSLSDV